MILQEIYDHVRDHLLTQNKRSARVESGLARIAIHHNLTP